MCVMHMYVSAELRSFNVNYGIFSGAHRAEKKVATIGYYYHIKAHQRNREMAHLKAILSVSRFFSFTSIVSMIRIELKIIATET